MLWRAVREGLNPGKKGRTTGGKTIHHGAQLCSYHVCILCEDGRLEVPSEMSTNNDELPADSAGAYFVSGYGSCR